VFGVKTVVVKIESIGLGDYVDLATGEDMDLRMEVPDLKLRRSLMLLL